MKSSSNA